MSSWPGGEEAATAWKGGGGYGWVEYARETSRPFELCRQWLQAELNGRVRKRTEESPIGPKNDGPKWPTYQMPAHDGIFIRLIR